MLVTDVLARHDAMTQRAEAGAIADAYLTLTDAGRERFFRMLARDFWIDPDAVAYAAEVLGRAETPLARRKAEHELRHALTPAAGRLLRLFTGLDGGVKLLVDLRADLLRFAGDDEELAQVDEELYQHLVTLFDVGLLSLQRITWDAPAVAAREAHRVRGRARDRLVGRPQEPARLRPPLLRVLPSEHAGRTTRVRRGRVDDRYRARASEAARRDRA